MNKFINVCRARQENLRNLFPDLAKLEAVDETPLYQYLAVSVFNHWLSCDEAEDLLSTVTEEEQKRRNRLFELFNDKIIQSTEVLHFVRRGNRRNFYKFRDFTSSQALIDYLHPTSSQRYSVVLPQLKMVYFEGWDDTNVFYLLDCSHKNLLKKWAEEVGLYTLEKIT